MMRRASFTAPNQDGDSLAEELAEEVLEDPAVRPAIWCSDMQPGDRARTTDGRLFVRVAVPIPEDERQARGPRPGMLGSPRYGRIRLFWQEEGLDR